MFVGYLTHLTLDEIYSVDVMDTRLKASFGTALKFFDRRHAGSSLAMAAATAAAIIISPSTSTFVEGVSSRNLWTGLEQRLLPSGKWFGIVDAPRFARRDDGKTPDVTTGSIGERAASGESSAAEPQLVAPASPASAASLAREANPASVARPAASSAPSGSSGSAGP
jgi:hypothetical protein